jgi:EAL domain-containing protein (putative c-di-GMP-specific phosphodiesterase class I)/FixJ family two-component response regulator
MTTAADMTSREDVTARSAYVLDDDPGVRASVLFILTAIGYEALGFSTPAPMLAKLKASPPEVVILDLSLGQSDAVEVIRQLSILKYDGKVLLISGHDEVTLNGIQRIAERHGLAMLSYLHKPFRAGDLKSRLITPPHAVEATATAQQPKRVVIDLEEAMRAEWLELWYQPKIDLRSSFICGAEALLRARHPDHGIVSPAGILPPAGDPLHHPLSKFVIRRAMTDWQCFADAGLSMKLSINLPVSIISAPDFVNVMREQLPTDERFPGLIIEVTEDEVVNDPTWIHEISTQLKLYNVWISIDDFGQAHSSLSRLLELPCVELKLDREFVSGCSSDPLKYALCQTVVDLAHRVGCYVCAEGVEQPEDLRSVIKMGCDTVQGYIFARPMAPDVFIERVRAWPSDSVERLGRHVRETQGYQIDPAAHSPSA